MKRKKHRQECLCYKTMCYYERNLPHWHPAGVEIFLTWRLFGSLPAPLVRRIQLQNLDPGRQFLRFDGHLDRSSSGPVWLREPRIAELIVATLHKGQGELKQYTLRTFVVMPNHIHVLLEPHVELSRITRGIKGVTSRHANKVLRRTGSPFWQDESFDHWVRDSAERQRIQKYIEQNPVAAGLVRRPEDWPWSSSRK